MTKVNFTDRRAPQNNPTVPAVLPEDHPDAFLLNHYSYIKAPATGTSLKAASGYLSNQGTAYVGTGDDTTNGEDIFDLSAIEDIQWIEKYDNAKVLTYSAVIKIRNGGASPEDNSGVRAQKAVV